MTLFQQKYFFGPFCSLIILLTSLLFRKKDKTTISFSFKSLRLLPY